MHQAGAKKKQCSTGGVCQRHGAKVKRCSSEGCTNHAQKGGIMCVRHGARSLLLAATIHYKLVPTVLCTERFDFPSLVVFFL
jgi:hypothetical protein